MTEHAIYAIVDPKTKLIRYVGISSDFEDRRRRHLAARRMKTRPKAPKVKAWLWDTLKAGQEPDFLILGTVESEVIALEYEQLWVEKFAAIGHPLLNGWSEHKEAVRDAAATAKKERRRRFAIARNRQRSS